MTAAPQSSSSGLPELRRKERVSMAREICLHKGENPNGINRRGEEAWEKYEPLAGACIREAERLFALRTSPTPGGEKPRFCSCKASARDGQHMAWCPALSPQAQAGETKSAPVVRAPHDSGERLPSSDAAAAGAGTFDVAQGEQQRGNLSDIEHVRSALATLSDPLTITVEGHLTGTTRALAIVNAMREIASRAALRLPASPPAALPAGETAPILWCCHVRGPDDVYAAPDYTTALAWSDALNEINWSKSSKLNIKDPASWDECLIRATPAPWPHSAEAHAENLPKSIEGFSDPSALSSTPSKTAAPFDVGSYIDGNGDDGR